MIVDKKGRGFWWYLHRALCFVGLHATEGLSQYERSGTDLSWVSIGRFCVVCTKSWEDKRR